MKKISAILQQWCNDDGTRDADVICFENYDEAKKEFKKIKEEVRKTWKDKDVYEVDEREGFFRIYVPFPFTDLPVEEKLEIIETILF